MVNVQNLLWGAKMTTIFREVKEYDNGVYTSFIDTQSTMLFNNDIEKGLDYFETAGGTFLENSVTGEKIFGEIQLDDIFFMLQAMEDGEIEYDEAIYDDFMLIRRCCLLDENNPKRYASDFFNIYIL